MEVKEAMSKMHCKKQSKNELKKINERKKDKLTLQEPESLG